MGSQNDSDALERPPAARAALGFERLASDMHARLRLQELVIAELQRKLSEVKDERNSNVDSNGDVRDTDSGAALARSDLVCCDRLGTVAIHTATLTVIPDADPRLGRGNAAMDAGD